MYQCWACKGSKKCAQCNGAKYTRSAIDGREIPCPLCSTTGICNVCNGSGRSSTRTPEDEMEKLGIPKETFDKSSEGFSPRYRSSSARSGGCFIATTVYNSPYAPEVQTLRHFRDRLLLTSSTGKIFVAFYYRTSPMIAKLLSKSEVMKRMVQYCLLDPLVHLLRKCK